MNVRAVMGVLAVAMLVPAIGCVSTPSSPAVEEAPVEEDASAGGPAEATAEPTKTESKVAAATTEKSTAEEEPAPPEPVFVLVKEETYLANGVMDTYTRHSYDPETGRRIMSETFLANGDPRSRVELEYQDGRIQSRRVYGGDGSIESTTIYAYDGEEEPVFERQFDARERQMSASEYRYDASGKRVRWAVYDENDELLAYSTYEYEGDRLVRVDGYYDDGEQADYQILEYDDGLLVEEITYTPDRQKLADSTYAYEDGVLVRERHRSMGGTQIMQHEYDGNGNLVSTELYGPGDELISTKKYYYEEREVR